jgi:hypothetical protein
VGWGCSCKVTAGVCRTLEDSISTIILENLAKSSRSALLSMIFTRSSKLCELNPCNSQLEESSTPPPLPHRYYDTNFAIVPDSSELWSCNRVLKSLASKSFICRSICTSTAIALDSKITQPAQNVAATITPYGYIVQPRLCLPLQLAIGAALAFPC